MQFSYKSGLLIGLLSFIFTSSIYSHEIIDAKGRQDLEFEALVQACDNTKTAHGSQALRYLTSPMTRISDISARQTLLQHFVEQEKEYRDMLALLANVAEVDLHAAQYCSVIGGSLEPDDQKRQKIEKIERVFANAKGFYMSSILTSVLPEYARSFAQYNDSPMFLRCSYWAGMAGIVSLIVARHAFEEASKQWGLMTENAGYEEDIQAGLGGPQRAGQPADFCSKMKRAFGLNGLVNKLNFFHAPQVGTAEQRNKMVDDAPLRKSLLHDENATARDRINARMAGWVRNYAGKAPEGENDWCGRYKEQHPWHYRRGMFWSGMPSVVDACLTVAGSGYMVYYAGFRLWKNVKDEHALWEHVKQLSRWGTNVRKLAVQVKSYRGTWTAANSLLTTLNTPQMRNFFASVKTLEESWSKDHRWMHDPGRVLHIHYCAQKAAAQIKKVIRVVGEIDAWMSIVGAIKRYKLCPVAFVESPQAVVHASQLWSLLLDAETAVKSDVVLGHGPNKMLLTGPNGGGKSTVMKSIGQAVALAQSWGFAPADEFVCTPFDSIIIAMDSQQSLKANLSTFMAELKALKQMRQAAQLHARKGRHCLVILDEPCRGSIEIESAKRISQFCADLDAYENVAAVLATHMYDPACLAESLGSWHNCQLGYAFLRNGVVRTFKLLPGIAHWWFNDADKRELFLHSLEQVIEQVDS